MNRLNQLLFVLGIIAVLLLLVLQLRIPRVDSTSSFATVLSAQTLSADVVFVPVGNQDVRKFVFWDRRTNQIHIYTGSGKLEETWQVGTLGQDLKKQ